MFSLSDYYIPIHFFFFMFYFEYEESQFVLHNLYGKKEITVRIGNIGGGSAKGQNHLETF